MDKQTLIIGMAGTFNAALASEIVKQLSAAGLQVHHASVRYDNQVHFATGGPDDLKQSLQEYGTQASVTLVENGAAEVVTLEVVNSNVLTVLSKLNSFVSYEKRTDREKAPKPPKEKKKKGAEKGTAETTLPPGGPPAGDPTTPPEGQPEEKPADDHQPSTADDAAKAPAEDANTNTEA